MATRERPFPLAAVLLSIPAKRSLPPPCSRQALAASLPAAYTISARGIPSASGRPSKDPSNQTVTLSFGKCRILACHQVRSISYSPTPSAHRVQPLPGRQIPVSLGDSLFDDLSNAAGSPARTSGAPSAPSP